MVCHGSLTGAPTKTRESHPAEMKQLLSCARAVSALVWFEMTAVTLLIAAMVLDCPPCNVASRTTLHATTCQEHISRLWVPSLTSKPHSIQSTNCMCCCLAGAQAWSNVWRNYRGSSLKRTWCRALSKKSSMQLRCSTCNNKSSAYKRSLPATGTQPLMIWAYLRHILCYIIVYIHFDLAVSDRTAGHLPKHSLPVMLQHSDSGL